MNATNQTTFVGWTEMPNRRGTIDIIWSCLLVAFTSVWTVLHLNLPAKNEGVRTVVARKFRWVVMAILAPDLVTLYSSAQWKRARESVQHMHSLGHTNWSLEHAFYADSGGFWLDSPDYAPFPVASATILHLVKENYIICPSITKEEIWDKSKADKFAKGFALVQSIWLVFQSIARTTQGLPISPLELLTIAFVISTIMSYFFWLHKPQNTTVPTILTFNSNTSTLATVLREAGPQAAQPFTDTPFDFVEKPIQYWKRRPMLQHFDLKRRPLQRLPNDTIMPGGSKMTWWEVMLTLGSSVLHSTIHLLGWNFEFPTPIEQILWRVSSLTLASGLFVMLAVERLLLLLGFRGQPCWIWIWVKPELKQGGWKSQVIDVWGAFVTCCLVIARLFLIGEVFASLRALPEGVYQTVRWTNFIPHL
ncbi:hypothetical protein B0J14DRAFT_676103 [Halenospora varia]|nr:hypothetical protein B0J14DRAFT_676103 [Halenospora varia]